MTTAGRKLRESFTDENKSMRRLMSHLAHFSSISKQGELLCTQGLTYLLRNPDACRAFAVHVSEQIGRPVDAELTWRAEARQRDGGRCDLQAPAEGNPQIKIEAKLGAPFGAGQLRSYVADLCVDGGLLLVLVPRHRAAEIIASVSKEFTRSGEGPWLLGDQPGCLVGVIYWEDILDALNTVCSEPFSGDLAQFQAMYRALSGRDIEPITSDAEILAWRQKEGDYLNLVDRVTRRLTQDGQVLPIGLDRRRADSEGACHSYQRRYVCLPFGNEQSCFSIGVRDPFEGHKTPIWLRFHLRTPGFTEIRDRLRASSLSRELLESGGHIWVPLHVLLNLDGDRQVASLMKQAERVVEASYRSS